jgi:hypothetical protein
MSWKLYIDSPQQKALDLCGGSLTEGGGYVNGGVGDGMGYGNGSGGGVDNDCDGNGNGCGRGYGGAAGDGWSEDKW